jgi:hypothetical protein
LTRAHSPYLVEGIADFKGTVTIEAGSTIRLTSSGANVGGLVFEGRVTADGTASPIVIQTVGSASNVCTSNDSGDTFSTNQSLHLDFSKARPGATQFNSFKKVSFLDLNILANGGTFDGVIFGSGCTSTTSYFGSLEKRGRDVLNIKNSTFDGMAAIMVTSGSNTTTIQESHGCFRRFVQNNGATGTKIINNNLNPSSGQDNFGPCKSEGYVMMPPPVLRITTGSIDLSNSRFTMTSDGKNFVEPTGGIGAATLVLSDFDVSGTGCKNFTTTMNQSLTVSNATIQCTRILKADSVGSGVAGSVLISQSDVTVSEAVLVTRQYFYGNYSLTLSNNRGAADGRTYGVRCRGLDGSTLCDFARAEHATTQWGTPINISLDWRNNDFECISASAGTPQYCRGGFVATAIQCQSCGNSDSLATTNWTVNLTGSTFVGKALPAAATLTANVYTNQSVGTIGSYDSYFGTNHPGAEDTVGIGIYDFSWSHSGNANPFTRTTPNTYSFTY